MKKFAQLLLASAIAAGALTACDSHTSTAKENPPETVAQASAGKPVIYQVLPRLFGNTNSTNKPWGTVEENGVGKFNDFTPEALAGIRALGANYIWYTGSLHHGVVRDYTDIGISNDDPDVIKGRAGSPYAVKDYYTVNPDLAEDPARRLEEFKALIERSHAAGLKVIIDIVPNHVARNYQSLAKPEGVRDFGADDDTSVAYARDNNFYYVPGQPFLVPEAEGGYQPLNGEPHPLVDGLFSEVPAKWTGNGSRAAQPKHDDWYETVKINFGVRPDGSHDFPELPADYAHKDYRAHAAFWADKEVPDSWKKFRQITDYWLDFGVDGFRYDMAGMVPVAFWSYLNSGIKMQNPDALLLAEIYQPDLYRDYVRLGKMDYLYDKVGTYDAIRAVMEHKAGTDPLVGIQQSLNGIEDHMLRFLENHDEQRIASPEFASSPRAGIPAMIVSATISGAPTLVYFGQELGEPGYGDAGFGKSSRTTIFDYWSVPSIRRWNNDGAFNSEKLNAEEIALRDFYRRLLNFTRTSAALRGEYRDLHAFNRANGEGYGDRLFSFVRWQGDEKLLVIANFADSDSNLTLQLPAELVQTWQLRPGKYTLTNQLQSGSVELNIDNDLGGAVELTLPALSGQVLQLAN
ncbi:alpha-amylase family glycosyl hydrolase [Microbulbifer bruguierae]|uniref:Alpha-amylase family glycosyl hydrolase n=1 Tax=Microbulbifer bruguierae TaxID=3029061 RepID=A0ABY8NIJ7_9GAMM|nr:alpha-amylase family glycosyl hydrolase [Microbulbifer bruguierae]WGL18417.1 alpha-amylase family glycosyl hydrolase [Microbulbifer bruguierae]